jgi:hypothetical protein
MIDESLLKSNFIGRDGFRWWIGQIPPIESMGQQVEGGGWGNRFKVRIIGYHPYDINELPNEELPWAQCLVPTTAGTGAANCSTGVQLQPGDMVLGFFLDGDNAQIPVILAAFGRTTSVPSNVYSSPFVPFTGYSSKIPVNDKLGLNEASELSKESQPTPRDLSFGKVIFANTIGNTKTLGIINEIDNLLRKVKNLDSSIITGSARIQQEIRKSADKIQSIANDFIGTGIGQLYTQLIPVMQGGLDLLYQKVYALVFAATQNSAAAHLAGVAAQTAMVGPVKSLEDTIPCLAGQIGSNINSAVTDLILSTVNNIDVFRSCASDQFTGSLLNTIIDRIDTGLSGPIGGVNAILQFFPRFSTGGTIRDSVDGIRSIGALFDCNQDTKSYKDLVNQWSLGTNLSANANDTYNNILENVNIQKSGSNVSDVKKCFTGIIDIASPPIINIFGGQGNEARAIPLFGSLVNDGNRTTSSIIGVQVINGGSGYRYPPFVEINDDANQGYGAIARSLINEKGEVVEIYIVSEGENYTPGDITEYFVSSVVVENSGSGYKKGDVVVDNLGNTYSTQITDSIAGGRIYSVQPLNNTVKDLPILSVQSSTGFGAVLKPILSIPESRLKELLGSDPALASISRSSLDPSLPVSTDPKDPNGRVEIQQIIDCIT